MPPLIIFAISSPSFVFFAVVLTFAVYSVPPLTPFFINLPIIPSFTFRVPTVFFLYRSKTGFGTEPWVYSLLLNDLSIPVLFGED